MKQQQSIDNKEVTVTQEPPEIWLRTVFRRNGLSCSDQQMEKLQTFGKLLLEWNKSVNLVSRRDVENLWEGHFLHSLALLFKFRFRERSRVLDLGTGGGLPGVPLKILEPSVSLVLMDATKKKVAAVQSMIEELGLSETEAVWGRAENLGKLNPYAGKFDHVIARGVAPLDQLVRLARPFLKQSPEVLSSGTEGRQRYLPHGSLVAYKGGQLDEEIGRARESRLVKGIEMVDLSFPGSERMSGTDKKLLVAKL